MNYVAGFNFRVRHCPGLKHVLPHHLSHLYGILPGGEREKREEAFEVGREEREEEKRDERAERARKKKERGSGEVGTKERVEVAEMATRLRVREQVAEGSAKKREKRRQRRKNQKEKMKESRTRVLNKGVSTGKGEEGREKEVEQEGEVGLGEGRGEEEEGEREEGEEGVGEVEEEGGGEEKEEGEVGEIEEEEEREEGEGEEEEGEVGVGEVEEGGGEEEGEVGGGEIEEEEEREEGEEGEGEEEEGEVGVGEVEEGGGEEEGEVGGGEIEEEEGEEEEEEGGDKQEGGEKEREGEGRSKEGKEVGVQHLRVSDVPTKDLRMLEKRFAEEIMGAKWVEGEQDRQKLLAKVHGKAHEGEGKLFMRLLAEGWYWTDMKWDCRREAAGCRMCLQYNVGQKGFHVMRSRGVVYPMQTCHTDHLMGLEKVGPAREFQDVLVVLDSVMRLVWLRAVKTTTTEETIRKMEKIFYLVGWPGTLVSDEGPAFMSVKFKEWLESHDVDHEPSTPGAHEHNAPAERWMREIRAVLNKKLDMKRDGWWEELQEVQEALNTRWVKPLQSTLFKLFYARTPEMRRVPDEEREEEVTENVKILRERGEVMREEVLPVIAKKAKEVRQQHCDKQSAKKKRAKTFEVGQLVMVDKNRDTKQDPFYEGPFQVKGFSEKKAEYQLTRFREDEVTIRTRHEHLKKVVVWKELDQKDRYVVTRVEGMREVGGERQYQVKWKGH